MSDSKEDVDDLRARLERIETLLSSSGMARTEPATGHTEGLSDLFWVLEGLRERYPAPGAVIFSGTVRLPGEVTAEWQSGLETAELLEREWSATATSNTLASLGHPVRLRILQAVARGISTVAELVELDGLGTTGQVYHHVNQLLAAGWLHGTGRGHYGIPAEKVVPLLIIVLAAAGT